MNESFTGYRGKNEIYGRSSNRTKAKARNLTMPTLPPDHALRMQRVLLALEGVSIGDGLGDFYLYAMNPIEEKIRARLVPPAPWLYTDDTDMALAVAEVLGRGGGIDREQLAAAFVRRYRGTRRDYGRTTCGILDAMIAGTPWRVAAQGACNEQQPVV